ncbi:MAG: NADH-quinone oxidoreductase subunit J [Actinomycetota bacterium]
MEKFVFWPVATLCLGSAIAMLMARNAVHSAMWLVVNFFTLAVFYVVLDAHFLAAAQIIVYAGAIMVLFLFVIMLLGVDREEDLVEPIRGQRYAAIIGGGLLAGITVYTVKTALSGLPFKGLKDANKGGNVEALGRVLFSKYLWPFEVTSLLLIIAAIGAIVIGRRVAEPHEPEEEQEPGVKEVVS